MDDPRGEPDPWKSASWAGAEATILEAGARLSLAERLRWLEQAAAAARALAGEGEAASPSRSSSASEAPRRSPEL